MARRWAIDDAPLEGSVRREGSELILQTDSGETRFEVLHTAGGEALLGNGGRLHRVAWARAGDRLWIHHEGRVWTLKAHVPGAARRAASARDSVPAPMTGKLLALEVQPGDQVSQGQVVGVLEAMKMQCDLTAPRAGRVRETCFSPGDQVPGGAPILHLEEEPAGDASGEGGSS